MFILSAIYKGKKEWWKILTMSKKGLGGLVWCVVGDFNAVKAKEERRGRKFGFDANEARGFQDLIDELNLIDLPFIGRRFTWFKANGSASSRSDRFLVLEGWIDVWKSQVQKIGLRDVSDHCPILLRGEPQNWGPKSFRFNNFWA